MPVNIHLVCVYTPALMGEGEEEGYLRMDECKV